MSCSTHQKEKPQPPSTWLCMIQNLHLHSHLISAIENRLTLVLWGNIKHYQNLLSRSSNIHQRVNHAAGGLSIYFKKCSKPCSRWIEYIFQEMPPFSTWKIKNYILVKEKAYKVTCNECNWCHFNNIIIMSKVFFWDRLHRYNGISFCKVYVIKIILSHHSNGKLLTSVFSEDWRLVSMKDWYKLILLNYALHREYAIILSDPKWCINKRLS